MRPRTSSLPFKLWPNRDRKLWFMNVVSTEDWLDQTRAAGWHIAHVSRQCNSYGRWLRWLQTSRSIGPWDPAYAAVLSRS